MIGYRKGSIEFERVKNVNGVIPATYTYHFYPFLAMVDWHDPDLEAKLRILSGQLLYAILGLYGWHYMRSSHVEISLLRRQLPFRWPLFSYLTARFSFLITIILSAMQFSPFNTSFDCQNMNFINMFSANVALGCSTTNLMIRTWLIWKTSYLLRLILVLLALGYWTMLTLFVVTARASTIHGVCMISYVKPAYASAVVTYTMVYDLALLVFTIIGLLRMPSSSTLWKKLVKQGVVYFVANLVANLVLLIMGYVNLNPAMSDIFAVPGM
ncbi:uncharacterized protein EDB93DRAFT_1145454 [Suillus bovinus]|uniref:uncharacterized protein n=1 Tax=Suillus bovinus TaxID=48563 RepID=UPI001B85D7E6|nr:uncharacterized protein EDB93DRAFT_1145454 [Suillus bovinus]KAG2147821.1 hypothetical protein EDB93DRAFT_1145454 [Suillus bovinus]